MPIVYKVDILVALKEKGFSSYRLRREKLMGQRDMQQIRAGIPVSWAVIGRICELLGCQVGDIVEYVPDTIERDKISKGAAEETEEGQTVQAAAE